MKLTFVEDVPMRRTIGHHKLQDFIKKFAESDYKVAKVDFTEEDYANVRSCVNSLKQAI